MFLFNWKLCKIYLIRIICMWLSIKCSVDVYQIWLKDKLLLVVKSYKCLSIKKKCGIVPYPQRIFLMIWNVTWKLLKIVLWYLFLQKYNAMAYVQKLFASLAWTICVKFKINLKISCLNFTKVSYVKSTVTF